MRVVVCRDKECKKQRVKRQKEREAQLLRAAEAAQAHVLALQNQLEAQRQAKLVEDEVERKRQDKLVEDEAERKRQAKLVEEIEAQDIAADRKRQVEAMAENMRVKGFYFLCRSHQPDWWYQTIAEAAGCVRHKIDMHQHAIIISNRRQWKFGSDYNKLPSCVLKLVRGLEEDVFKCCGTQDICLHDCYAITTPSDDNSIEGRGPQPWHLDSFFSFPQAVCLLSGGSLTEFAAGCYTDFSEEFQAAKAKGFRWSHNAAGRFRNNITSKYNLDSRCWNQ